MHFVMHLMKLPFVIRVNQGEFEDKLQKMSTAYPADLAMARRASASGWNCEKRDRWTIAEMPMSRKGVCSHRKQLVRIEPRDHKQRQIARGLWISCCDPLVFAKESQTAWYCDFKGRKGRKLREMLTSTSASMAVMMVDRTSAPCNHNQSLKQTGRLMTTTRSQADHKQL